jgi:hypothetical protein
MRIITLCGASRNIDKMSIKPYTVMRQAATRLYVWQLTPDADKYENCNEDDENKQANDVCTAPAATHISQLYLIDRH